MTNPQTPSPTDPGDLTQPRVEPTGGEPPAAAQLDLAMARINTVSSRIQAGASRTLLVGILLLAAISGISVSGLPQLDKQLDPKLAAPKIKQFLEHHGISRNPFAEEDAQTDPVFQEHCIDSSYHPSWEKIYGDPSTPATSLVFGEKGSGKFTLAFHIINFLNFS